MKLHLDVIEDKNLWEDFLLKYCPQALFQTWQWGQVQEQSKQPVKRYGIYDHTQLIGIAQLTVVKAKRGTFIHVRHGPIWKSQTKAYWREFIVLIKKLAQKERAWFVRISPLLDNTQEHRDLLKELGLVAAPIHEVDAERCWVLDIDKNEEELLMGMRKTTRYEIRLAQKSDVTIKTSTDPKDVVHFFKLYEETSKRHGFVAHSSIAEEFEVFSKEKKALLFLGYAGKELIAGTIVLFYGNQAIYHHGASISSKVPVSYLVQWHAILEAKKRGIKLYNFYGIAPEDNPNHPWRGITLFKKGFGGREINYIHAHDLPTSFLYPIPWTIETIRRKRRGY